MGDKNPKQKERSKKQGDEQKKRDKEAHDKKHAPAPPGAKK